MGNAARHEGPPPDPEALARALLAAAATAPDPGPLLEAARALLAQASAARGVIELRRARSGEA